MDDKKQALIVDDEPNMVRAIERVLKSIGFETFTAQDAFEASVWLEQISPTLITLDIMMPDLRGDQMLEMIQAMDNLAQTRILAISGVSRLQLNPLLHHGVDDVLQKPFSNEELIKKVQDLTMS